MIDESLITLLTKVESILNSRPLTVETLGDVESEAPLSLVRPIYKIKLLFESNEVRFPDGIKMMNHLEGSHVLMVDSCEL